MKKLCEMKGVQLIERKVCMDHIHMYVVIPPKMSVSEFMSYLKGKGALMFCDRHPEMWTKWGDRHEMGVANLVFITICRITKVFLDNALTRNSSFLYNQYK